MMWPSEALTMSAGYWWGWDRVRTNPSVDVDAWQGSFVCQCCPRCGGTPLRLWERLVIDNMTQNDNVFHPLQGFCLLTGDHWQYWPLSLWSIPIDPIPKQKTLCHADLQLYCQLHTFVVLNQNPKWKTIINVIFHLLIYILWQALA